MNASDIAVLYIEAMLHVRQLKRERAQFGACTDGCDEDGIQCPSCHRTGRDLEEFCDTCTLRHAKTLEIWPAAAKQAALLRRYNKAKEMK